jgi:hypothetical protein
MIALRSAIRDGISSVIGERLEGTRGDYRPHTSIAYPNQSLDIAPVHGAPRRASATVVRVRPSAVRMLLMQRDHRMYEWDSYIYTTDLRGTPTHF